MKILFTLLFGINCFFSYAQICDTVRISHSFFYDNGDITDNGYGVDSIHNGKVISQDGKPVVYYYDSLQRLISIVDNNTDSVLYSYDSNLRLFKREYFQYNSNYKYWQYRYDTAATVNFYRSDGSDSLYVYYRWNNYSLVPFKEKIFYYSNNILKRWELLSDDGWGFKVDSTFNVYFTGQNSRIDSGWTGIIKPASFESVIKYDSLFRIIRTEELYGGVVDGFADYGYECGESSGYYSSCIGCHSSYSSTIIFDSLCRRFSMETGGYSMTSITFTKTYYFYADCNNMVLTGSPDLTVCQNDTTTLGIKNYGGRPPYHVQWFPSVGLENDTAFITKAFPHSTTTYSVTISDSSGLTATDTVSVFVENAPYSTLHIKSIDSVSTCQSAILSTDSVDKFTFTWFFENEILGLRNSDLPIKVNGNYVVYISNGNYCAGIYDSLAVSSIPRPTPQLNLVQGCGYIVAVTNEPCQFQWNSSYPFTYGLTPDTIYVTSVGDYSVVAIDSNGCHSDLRKLYYYYEQPGLVKQNSCSDSCKGWISANGGLYSYYLWNTGDSTNTITNLCPGIYSVFIQDGHGCDTTLQDTVFTIPNVSYTVISTGTSNVTSCDGYAMIVDSTNSTYTVSATWQDGTNDLFKDSLCQGWNYFNVKNNYTGCPQYDSVFVKSGISTDTCSSHISITNNLCSGQANATATVNMVSGYPFGCNWLNTNGTDRYNPTVHYLPQGIYYCVLIDSTGCIDTATAVITDPTPVNSSFTFYQSPCNDSCSVALSVSGGTSPYSYLWCNGDSQAISNNCENFCEVTVMDAAGCYFTTTTEQTMINPLSLSLQTTPATCPGCNDGFINITAGGGASPYTYSIDSTFVGSSQVISNLSPGTYNICVIGSDSCMHCDSATITFLIGVNELETNSVRIFPNPANDFVKILFTENLTNAGYDLTDNSGRTIDRGKINGKEFTISTQYLTGNYFLKVATNKGIIHRKIIVIN